MVNPLLDSLPPLPGNNQGLRSQARLEETLQPRYEPTPSQNPVVPYYTGLILLSILTFLFLLFLLFKKQIKEVRFATFATVLMGVGLPLLAIVQLTTDLVLREEAPPTSPRPTDPQSQQPARDREEETEATDPADPEEQPETAVVEIPLNFPNPASETGSSSDAPGARDSTVDDPTAADASGEGLTLSMAGPPRPSSTTSPQGQDLPPTSTANRPIPLEPVRNPEPVRHTKPTPSPLAPFTRFSQSLPRTTPRPTFSLSHLDFSQSIRFERILHLNLQGLDVLALQKLLQDLDFYRGPLDGYMGRQTQAAIAQFQGTYALLPDGIFGLSTCEILNAQTPDLTLICAMTALED